MRIRGKECFCLECNNRSLVTEERPSEFMDAKIYTCQACKAMFTERQLMQECSIMFQAEKEAFREYSPCETCFDKSSTRCEKRWRKLKRGRGPIDDFVLWRIKENGKWQIVKECHSNAEDYGHSVNWCFRCGQRFYEINNPLSTETNTMCFSCRKFAEGVDVTYETILSLDVTGDGVSLAAIEDAHQSYFNKQYFRGANLQLLLAHLKRETAIGEIRKEVFRCL